MPVLTADIRIRRIDAAIYDDAEDYEDLEEISVWLVARLATNGRPTMIVMTLRRLSQYSNCDKSAQGYSNFKVQDTYFTICPDGNNVCTD